MTLEDIAREYPHRKFVLNSGTPVSRDSPTLAAFYEDGELVVAVLVNDSWHRASGVVRQMVEDLISKNYLRWVAES